MLAIRHNRHWHEPRLPHLVFIDGLYAGTMQVDSFTLELPPGNYSLKVQFGGKLPLGRSGRSVDLSVSAVTRIELARGEAKNVTFHDRERLWNVLFDIDLVLWLLSLFVAMPPLYKILSDTFFAVWLVRLVLIRKRYYSFST